MASPDSGQRKLGFRVVFASSQDADYPASELNTHTPTTKGWQSARFAEYPQEVGIQFVEGLVNIAQIQILSHQCKIAKRVELFTGDGPDYFHAQFTRLGYLSLDSNERSQFKARELKSVYVKARGTFLKMLLHQCYVNQHNLFNQVGLIAINVLGQPASALPEPGRALPAAMAGVPAAGNVVPAGVNDLAVDMGLDPETAAMLRDVARRKEAAVAAEDFETAKRLKVVQDSIKSVGGQLAALVAQKARAVADEDYDAALHIKAEIQRIRNGLAERLADAGLSFGGGLPPRAPPAALPYGGAPAYGGPAHMPPYPAVEDRPIRPAPAVAAAAPVSPSAASPTAPPGAGPSGPMYDEIQAPPSPDRYGGRPGSRAIRPAAASTLDEAIAAEERRLADAGPDAAGSAAKPARRVQTKAERAAALAASEAEVTSAADPFKPADGGAHGRPDASQLAGVEGAAELPAPEPLSAAAEKDAGPIIDLFGMYVAQCFYSKDWHLREAAVAKMAMEVPNVVAGKGGQRASESDIFQACSTVAITASKDKIAAVFEKAVAKLLPTVLQGSTTGLKRPELTSALDPLMPQLVEKLGDNTPRVRDAAVAAVLEIAAHPLIGSGFVASFVLHKMSKKQASSWKPLQTRVAVLAELVEKSNLLAPGSGVSADTLMKYCADLGTFGHANAEIRKATEDLATAVYKVVGKALLPLLQPHLRPKQMEEYQAAFAAAGPGGAAGAVAGPPGRAPPPAPARAAAAPAPTRPGGAGDHGKKPAGGAASKPAPHPAPAAAPPEGEEEGVCQFCGGCGPGASEQELDLHYWQACPMLMACPRCQQIIEIATLHEHLLDECEFKTEFEPCPNCGDAIPAASLDQHLAAGTCKPLPDPAVAQRCSLCQADIPPDKDGWLHHLLDVGCPENPRKQGRAPAAPARGAPGRPR